MRKYFILGIFTIVLTFSFWPRPAAANMPQVIRPCLVGNPLFSSPKQFREIAKVRAGQTIYYYLSLADIAQNPFPNSTIVTVQNGQCKNLGNPMLGVFTPLTQYVPTPVATYLATARWKTVLSTSAGKQFIQSLSKGSKPAINEMGERLDPIKLPSFDVMILRKLGARI